MQINSFAPLIASLRVNVLPLVNGPSRSMFTPDAKEISGTVRFTQQPSRDHQKLKLESVRTNNALQWMPFLPILPRQSSSSRFVYTIDRATTACLHFDDAPVGDSLKCNGSLLNLTGRSAYCFCWLLEDFRCWSNSDGWPRLHKLYWQKQELLLTQSVYRICSEYTPCASANCYSRYPNASI